MKSLFVICCLITPILASTKVATVDMADLFDSDPEVIAFQKKLNAQHAKIKADNETRLKEIKAKHAMIEALSRKLENPQISKKEKNDLLRERQLAIQKGLQNPYDYLRSLKKMQKALEVKIKMETRKALFRIQEKTQNYSEANNISLLLDKSLKGKNQHLALVYSDARLDITEQLKAGKKSAIEKGISLDKLKVATINLNLFPKNMKHEILAKIVAEYAKKNTIHLVFDSSAESTTHSNIISFAAESLDITDQITQQTVIKR